MSDQEQLDKLNQRFNDVVDRFVDFMRSVTDRLSELEKGRTPEPALLPGLDLEGWVRDLPSGDRKQLIELLLSSVSNDLALYVVSNDAEKRSVSYARRLMRKLPTAADLGTQEPERTPFVAPNWKAIRVAEIEECIRYIENEDPDAAESLLQQWRVKE